MSFATAEHRGGEGKVTEMNGGGRSVDAHGMGPFVTWVTTTAEGVHRIQTSRRRRKRLAPIVVRAGTPSPHIADVNTAHDWSKLWWPARLGWWIAVLFMVGSALFALGGVRAAWPGLPGFRWIDVTAINPIFFLGSLFFTSAAYLQLHEAVSVESTRYVRVL